MLKREDLQVIEEFGNQTAPFQYRVTHIPTGISVMGNTGSEAAKSQLLDTLVVKLESCLPDYKPAPAQPGMQAEIDELKAMVAALLAGKQPVKKEKVKAEAPKRRGRPKGSKIVDGKMVAPESVAPAGYSVLDPSKVQAPPVIASQERRSFKPSQTVAVSNVKDIAA